jgi:hypothetical protein
LVRQPVLMTQRQPRHHEQKELFCIWLCLDRINWSKDGFLFLSRHECRQQLHMPLSGLPHIYCLLATDTSARKG